MACCVISPLYLGCFSVCDTLDLNMTIASDAGQYTAVFKTHGTQLNPNTVNNGFYFETILTKNIII